MGDVLDEVSAIAQCKDCPWYKSCVSPMRFTVEDIRRQLESQGGLPGANVDAGMQNLIGNMAAAAQNSMLEACPVFIDRLRASPRLSQALKQIMLNWGSDPQMES